MLLTQPPPLPSPIPWIHSFTCPHTIHGNTIHFTIHSCLGVALGKPGSSSLNTGIAPQVSWRHCCFSGEGRVVISVLCPVRILQGDVCEVPTSCLACTMALTHHQGRLSLSALVQSERCPGWSCGAEEACGAGVTASEPCEESCSAYSNSARLAVGSGNNLRPHPSPLVLSDGNSCLVVSRDSGCCLVLDLKTDSGVS